MRETQLRQTRGQIWPVVYAYSSRLAGVMQPETHQDNIALMVGFSMLYRGVPFHIL